MPDVFVDRRSAAEHLFPEQQKREYQNENADDVDGIEQELADAFRRVRVRVGRQRDAERSNQKENRVHAIAPISLAPPIIRKLPRASKSKAKFRTDSPALK